MAWSILNKPKVIEEIPGEIPIPTEDIPADSVQIARSTTDTVEVQQVSQLLQNQYSVFASHAVGSESLSRLENEHMSVTFTNKGGRIRSVELKDYYKLVEDEDGEEKKTKVLLFEDEDNRFDYRLPMSGTTVNTADLYFDVSEASNRLDFQINTPDGGYFVQSYTLAEDGYQIDYDVQFYGLNNVIQGGRPLQLHIENHLDAIEKNVTFEKRYSSVYYKEPGEGSDYCSCTGDDTDDRSNRSIEWVSFVNQFFNTSLISDDLPFEGVIASNVMAEDGDENLKLSSTTIHIPYRNGFDERVNMTFYTGPNEYSRLRAFDNGLEEIIPFGRSIFGEINRLFIRPFFDWLTQYIGSKGLVIIVLIFIIKMALYPLTYKMLHSQAKMGALKPELAKLKERHKGDAQKQQMETMKIYREYGVSPFGGCMPMVVQMPIWYALFRFFPASITFRQESFLWATDLSSFDVLFYLPFEIPMMGAHLSLFTILWAITTVIYTFYNMRHMDMSANPAMKYVQYMMPIMFFVFFNNYASGLTCYMFFSNLMNIAQTILTKRFVFDDEKILAELNIQKAKPKKKNSFQARLEEAMKQQQRAQEMKETKKRKKTRRR